MKAAICAVAKNENDYIKEWVEYHLRLGFSKIFIHDNNNPGDNSLSEVLSEEIEKQTVEIIDYRGRKSFQMEAYNTCYGIYGMNYDWMAFIDIDEFITIAENSGYENIAEFLSDAGDDADAILINWMFYGDNGKVHYEKGNVVDRFPRPVMPLDNYQNRHVKSIARTGRNIKFETNVHCVEGENLVLEDDCFKKVPGVSPLKSPSFQNLYIRHYGTKTVEEFIRCKIGRGAADSEYGQKIYRLKLFYRDNLRTKEKRDVEKALCPGKMVMMMDIYDLLKKLGIS